MNTNFLFVTVYFALGIFCYYTWRKYKDRDFLYLSLLSIPAALNRVLENFSSNYIYQVAVLKSVTDAVFFFFWAAGAFFAMKILIRGLMKK